MFLTRVPAALPCTPRRFTAATHLILMKASLSGFSRASWRADQLNQVCLSSASDTWDMQDRTPSGTRVTNTTLYTVFWAQCLFPLHNCVFYKVVTRSRLRTTEPLTTPFNTQSGRYHLLPITCLHVWRSTQVTPVRCGPTKLRNIYKTQWEQNKIRNWGVFLGGCFFFGNWFSVNKSRCWA